MALIPLVILFILMYVMVIRPQQQRVRRQQALVASLTVGDQVVTAGGVYGRIVTLDDDVAVLEVAPGVTLRFVRGAITQRVGDDNEVGELPAAEDATRPDGEE